MQNHVLAPLPRRQRPYGDYCAPTKCFVAFALTLDVRKSRGKDKASRQQQKNARHDEYHILPICVCPAACANSGTPAEFQ